VAHPGSDVVPESPPNGTVRSRLPIANLFGAAPGRFERAYSVKDWMWLDFEVSQSENVGLSEEA